MSTGLRPATASTFRIAAMNPPDRSPGVDGVFATQVAPVSASANVTSVNVPPTAIATGPPVVIEGKGRDYSRSGTHGLAAPGGARTLPVGPLLLGTTEADHHGSRGSVECPLPSCGAACPTGRALAPPGALPAHFRPGTGPDLRSSGD